MKNPHYYQTLVEDSTLALNSRVLYLIKITGNVLRSLVHVHTCTRVPLYTMLGTNFQFCYHLCVSPGISLLRLEVHLLSLCSTRGAWQGFWKSPLADGEKHKHRSFKQTQTKMDLRHKAPKDRSLLPLQLIWSLLWTGQEHPPLCSYLQAAVLTRLNTKHNHIKLDLQAAISIKHRLRNCHQRTGEMWWAKRHCNAWRSLA